MEWLFSEEYTAMWDAISSIMGIIATLMAIVALIYSVRTYKSTMQVVHYGEIDRMYFDILKEALAKPHLAHSDKERSDAENAEYDIYAFIVWNFLEAIYDRSQHSSALQKTWYPIVQTESGSHKQWLDIPQNRAKFKNAFLDFIDREGYRSV